MMQRFIAWLLERYTPFRVVAWEKGKIAGIVHPDTTRDIMAAWTDEWKEQFRKREAECEADYAEMIKRVTAGRA